MSFVEEIKALFKTGDTTYQSPRLDVSTHAVNTIDYAHHEIHAGSSFTFNEVIQLGNAGVQDYIITTPDTTKWTHFGYEVESCAGGVTVEIFTGTDRDGTTLQNVYNRNHNSQTTATTTVHKGQTGGTTDGTKKTHWTSGTGTSAGKVAGRAGESTERILQQNTKYLFRVTSKAASNDIAIRFNWYEHTNRTA